MYSEVWQTHGTVCNYTLINAHLNGVYKGWGVIATMNGTVYQPPWTFRPSCYAMRSPIDTCLVSKKFYKSPLTNYDFGVLVGGLLLKLQNFKKVKLILDTLYITVDRWGNLSKTQSHTTHFRTTHLKTTWNTCLFIQVNYKFVTFVRLCWLILVYIFHTGSYILFVLICISERCASLQVNEFGKVKQSSESSYFALLKVERYLHFRSVWRITSIFIC